ncbi:MAG: hypothetical protein NTV21_02005 [Planctomycetota bacterium]|nr:hypothetical protein [Planctomycetota bacterium]
MGDMPGIENLGAGLAARCARGVRPSDTSPAIQARMDAWYRSLSPTERGELLRDAWRAGRELQLAGLRARLPQENEAQLELRPAERWLGPERFARVREQRRERGMG